MNRKSKFEKEKKRQSYVAKNKTDQKAKTFNCNPSRWKFTAYLTPPFTQSQSTPASVPQSYQK
jgi:hypothetical protein